MNAALGSVLVVDDEPNVLSALGRLEFGAAFALHLCAGTAAANLALAEHTVEVALVDQHLGPGDPSGLDFLADLRRRDPDCYRIIFTGAADLQFAADAINRGLIDAFLVKPWSDEHLVALLYQGCETALLRRHNRQLAQELSQRNAALEYLNEQLERMVEERTANLRQTLDQMRHQQQELVRLETQGTVSQLARGLAHELNNPLAAIMGYTQRLQRKLAADPDSMQRLEVVLQEVERCRGLVDQLRGLAAPLDEAQVPCHPEEALAQAGARLRTTDRPPPQCRIEGEMPMVFAAPRSLVRVFELVLDNARLAGAATCWLSAGASGQRVRIILANDGATPTDEAIHNATRPFFTTMSQQGRRGLGLAIASTLLREQGGTIELDRRPGGAPGAVCVISLPAPTPTPLSQPVLPAGPLVGAVLIIDDDPHIAELLRDCLEEGELPVVVVGSVADAVATVARQSVRAVICDLHLRDGDGATLLRRLTAMRPGLAGHLAMITGLADSAALARMLGDTSLPILYKPFRLEEVRKLVRKIL